MYSAFSNLNYYMKPCIMFFEHILSLDTDPPVAKIVGKMDSKARKKLHGMTTRGCLELVSVLFNIKAKTLSEGKINSFKCLLEFILQLYLQGCNKRIFS